MRKKARILEVKTTLNDLNDIGSMDLNDFEDSAAFEDISVDDTRSC